MRMPLKGIFLYCCVIFDSLKHMQVFQFSYNYAFYNDCYFHSIQMTGEVIESLGLAVKALSA